jgi:hypothetical protein
VRLDALAKTITNQTFPGERDSLGLARSVRIGQGTELFAENNCETIAETGKGIHGEEC